MNLYWPIKTEFMLTIITTYKCNFKCSYCFERDKKSDINLKLLEFFSKNFYKKIKQLNLDEFHISVYGGELSIFSMDYHEKLFEILSNFDKTINNVYIHYLSNFSQDISKYNEILHLSNNYFKNFDFKFTMHNEYFTKNTFIEKYNLLLNTYNINPNKIQLKFFEENENSIKISSEVFNDSIDHQEYKKIVHDNFDLMRPVDCYAYNYIIDSDGYLFHECFNDIKWHLMEFNKIKIQKKFSCNKVCGCPALDLYTKKELKKDLKNGN